MIYDLKYPERHPYWEDDFELYRDEIASWRNYQLEDEDYNPYSLDDVEEQRKRDYFRGFSDYENDAFFAQRHKHKKMPHNQWIHRKDNKTWGNSEKPGNVQHHEPRKQHFPQRGNTDPFSDTSWVY